MGPPEKNDLFSISIFVTFTIITGKMYTILDHPDGNVVSKKHMHAAIHWIIRQIMTFNEKVSKTMKAFLILLDWSTQANPGRAWHAVFKGRQTRVAIACWPVASLGQIWQCFLCLPVDQSSGNKKSHTKEPLLFLCMFWNP